jgi:hypothetical protein
LHGGALDALARDTKSDPLSTFFDVEPFHRRPSYTEYGFLVARVLFVRGIEGGSENV